MTSRSLTSFGRSRAHWSAFFAALLAGSTAPAQTSRLTPYDVDMLAPVVMPAGQELIGQQLRLTAYDTVLTARLAYPRVARLDAAVQVTIAGEQVSLPAGAMIGAARVTGGMIAGEMTNRTFCLPPYRPSDRRRFSNFVQPCFVDTDGDRRLDAGFLAGTERAEDRNFVPLAGPAYEEIHDVPLPGAAIDVVFKPEGPGLAVQLATEDRPFVITRVRFSTPDGAGVWQSAFQNFRTRDYPRSVSFGSARFEILQYDRAKRVVELRVVAALNRAQVDYELPSGYYVITIPIVR